MSNAIVGLAILACWAASLLLPVVDTAASNGTSAPTGWDIVKIGWLGPLMGQFGWFANALLIPALGLAAGQHGEAPRARLIVGVILLLLASNSAFWTALASDAGEDPIIAYRSGYWLWMLAVASAGLWLVGSRFRQAARRNR